MADWSKPLSLKDRERGRKFQAVWNTLSKEEKRLVGSHYYTTDDEYVNPIALATGKEKLLKAGYSGKDFSELIDISMHPDCWTEEEWEEFKKKRLSRKSSPS